LIAKSISSYLIAYLYILNVGAKYGRVFEDESNGEWAEPCVGHVGSPEATMAAGPEIIEGLVGGLEYGTGESIIRAGDGRYNGKHKAVCCVGVGGERYSYGQELDVLSEGWSP
jgi:hypothetical protein